MKYDENGPVNAPTCPLPGHPTPQALTIREDSPHAFCPMHFLIDLGMLAQMQEAQAGPEVTSAQHEAPVPEPYGMSGEQDCSVCRIPWTSHLDRAFIENPPMREGGPPLRTPRAVDLGDCVALLLKEVGRG